MLARRDTPQNAHGAVAGAIFIQLESPVLLPHWLESSWDMFVTAAKIAKNEKGMTGSKLDAQRIPVRSYYFQVCSICCFNAHRIYVDLSRPRPRTANSNAKTDGTKLRSPTLERSVGSQTQTNGSTICKLQSTDESKAHKPLQQTLNHEVLDATDPEGLMQGLSP